MALATSISLTAERRETRGKGAARSLRRGGWVPAVVYGRGRPSEALSIAQQELERALAHRSATTIVDLTVDGKAVKTLIREIQRHPVRPGILHIDFYEIHEGETITLPVPIHLEGTPEGVRNTGGVLDQVLREIEIEVLARDIPDRIEVDVTALEIGQSIHVEDLVIENATVLANPKQTVCSVIAPRVEEVAEAPTEAEEPEEAEPELIRKPKEEGDSEE